MTAELKHYITRVMTVKALQLSLENLEEAAALCGGEYKFDKARNDFIVFVPSPHGTIVATPGWWLVYNGKGWVAMTNKHFTDKYERANAKGERVPPYSEPTSIPLELESMEMTKDGLLAKIRLPEGTHVNTRPPSMSFCMKTVREQESLD